MVEWGPVFAYLIFIPMITQKDIKEILKSYDPSKLTIGVLGGHSALDVCEGAKKYGFRTVCVVQKDRANTYAKYYRTREDSNSLRDDGTVGCIDEIIEVEKFADIVQPDVQDKLREMNTVFIHNRYFWVYFDFAQIENEFKVPIYGTRGLVKLEERDQPNNQYVLLEKAGIRIPKLLRTGEETLSEGETRARLEEYFDGGGGPLIVKVNEAIREYERAFYVITKPADYFEKGRAMIEKGLVKQTDLDRAVIEEFIIGAQINFNYFYSNLDDELELMGTDTRRQTSLDGFLRLDAKVQSSLLEDGYKPSMVETGHIACTTKESILEKAFTAGEKFVEMLKKEAKPGIIGPFALQGAIDAGQGKEEFVVFDVSMRIPGSPGTRFTPATVYKYGQGVSYGERIAMELKKAQEMGKLLEVLT
jgi:5-formaminoimidazole-4-carboxamide-1-(beta)-D-ribofuranosyl 5'-monophosphate synthetase